MALKTVTTSPYTCTVNDDEVILGFDGLKVVFLADAAVMPPGQEIAILNQGTGGVTVSPHGSQLIDGLVSDTLTSGTSHSVYVTDGANWFSKSS